MADYFVKSGGVEGDGLSWETAKITLGAAFAVAVGGDRVFVSKDHAETQTTGKTITSAGTPASPVQVYSVADPTTPAVAVTSGGSVLTTGSGLITLLGSVVAHGLTYGAGSGSSAASINLANVTTPDVIQIYNDCAFALNNTASAASLTVGSSGSSNGARSRILLNNVALRMGAASQRLEVYQELTWRGGSFLGSATQAHLLRAVANGRGVPITIEGVDLTGFAPTGDLVSGPSATGRVLFRNCSLPPNWSGQLVTAPVDPGLRVEMHNCDSIDTNYRMWVMAFSGSIHSETGITKTNGASDGVNKYSWRISTNANPTPGLIGLESPELARWNETVGAPVTVGIDILSDAALTNADVWLEAQFLGLSGLPKSSFASSKVAPLAAPVAHSASTAVWSGAGQKQRLSVTFTPQEIGAVHLRVVVAKKDSIVYVDPKVQVN